jgi:quercetin dioxygenase-like cupin family protein
LTDVDRTANMLGKFLHRPHDLEAPMEAAAGTVTADTAAVRVTRWDFGAGAGTGQHRHEHDYVVIPVSGGVFAVTDAQGATTTMQQVAGVPYLGKMGTAHDVVNATDQQVSFVEVELRADMAAAEPGVPMSQPSPSLSDHDRVLLLTSQVEVFALQVESMAVRHPQLAAECAELSGRMRTAVQQHRAAVEQPPPGARQP